jgi:Co/Zn/Cd efflux system component
MSAAKSERSRAKQRRVLRTVLGINVAMFLTESVAGILATSTALFADSIDMLGDAIVYGFSLYVLSRRDQPLLPGVALAAARR